MGRYIKIFKTHASYTEYINDELNKLLPNVSYCEDEEDVHFNPFTLLNELLDGVSISSNMEPWYNKPWVGTFVNDPGKQLIPHSVKIVMDDVDITDDSYNYETNQIYISSVTGNIEITAKGAEVNSAYKPIIVTRTLSRVTTANGNHFNIPYYPNNNTKLVLDVCVNQSSSYNQVLYAIRNPNTKPSTDNTPQFCFWVRISSNNNYVVSWGMSTTGTVNTAAGRFKKEIRQTFTCDKGTFTYINDAGNVRSLTLTSADWSYTSRRLSIFGENNGGSSTTYPIHGEIYRITISENDNLLFDYIPVKRLSDGKALLYNLVDNSIINLSSQYIGPYVNVVRTLTNCTLSRLSSAITGNSSYAVIGETCIYKCTPSASQYSFGEQNAVFQVLVNNVDKTNDYATYDPNTDAWTVTYVAHWKDEISITATAMTYVLHTYLDGVQLSNQTLPVTGSSWTTGFTCDTGKQLLPSSVIVKMAGVDITASVYNLETNTITIPEVDISIEITAVADVVDSAYKVVSYIGNPLDPPGADSGNVYNNHIVLDYHPNYKTNLNLNVRTFNTRSYTILVSNQRNVNSAGTTSNGRFTYWYRLTNTNYSSLYWGTQTVAEGTKSMNPNIKNNIIIKNGSVTYTDIDNTRRTITVSNTSETWSGNYNLVLFAGSTNSFPYYSMAGVVYDLKVSEDDVLLHYWVAVERLSDNACGLYDIVTGTYTNATNYISPFIEITNTRTNCSVTKLSSASSGYANYMCIGKQWSYKYTPSSGYSFNSSDAIFTVIVNSVDKTNDYATYDSATDTWTITLTAHWSDEISITATAIVIT